MNGVHDMGGMHGMGPIQAEKAEPVFHADWESRVFALTRAVGAWGKWNIDAFRYQKELIPAAEYLRMSYYETFLRGLTELLVNRGLTTRAEIESGQPATGSAKAVPVLTAARIPEMVARGNPASRDIPVRPAFNAGQQVRARNLNPTGHIRLPRYARGKLGRIVRDHGVFVFPSTNAHFLGEKPQHVYSVRFAARDLWGEQAEERDAVYVDIWEDYLERA
jgi:nitrile hydratase